MACQDAQGMQPLHWALQFPSEGGREGREGERDGWSEGGREGGGAQVNDREER